MKTNRRRGMKRVAVLVETSNSYARGLIQGVIEYARAHGRWSVYLGEHRRGDEPPPWVRRGDGGGGRGPGRGSGGGRGRDHRTGREREDRGRRRPMRPADGGHERRPAA